MPLRPLAGIKPRQDKIPEIHTTTRVRIWFAALAMISAIFGVRLFYLQVIKHDYYRQAALQGQLRQYEVPAERGVIKAHDGSLTTPIVLNEKLYTLFADPTYVKDADKDALAIAPIISGDANKLKDQLKTAKTRYVILAKKLNKQQKEKLDKLSLKGVGTREESYRTYPQGALASQMLGFVNDDGAGQYGLEQFLNSKLVGTPGKLKAITDAEGVPLVSNKSNIVTDPKPGETVTLTIDIGLQRQLEDILKAGLDRAKSPSGSALIIEANTGAVKAMANYPTYDPNKVREVGDLSLFSNAAVSSPLEVGSIMKTLTAGAALDTHAITTGSSFEDPGYAIIDDKRITDVGESIGTQTVQTILTKSLNTGAVWMLKQIGGGSINAKARTTWHDYMTEHYGLGSATGIEQAGEAGGVIPDPADNGAGINITYANTAFGQAMTATPLQMAAAFSALVNGGTLYQPRLVDTVSSKGTETPVKPVIKKTGVVAASTAQTMIQLLTHVVHINYPGNERPGYMIGGKTGTAQFTKPGGGYYDDRFNGTYLGFLGGDKPEYVIVVRVNAPNIPGFAGSAAAQPIFRDLSLMMIENYGVAPKSN